MLRSGHLSPTAGASTPPPAPSWAGWAWGEAGSSSPRDGWVELNPMRSHYQPHSPEPWLLSSQAREGLGREHSITRHP